MQADATITRLNCMGALLHLPGIGPLTEQRLRMQGIGSQRELSRHDTNELPGFADCAPPRTRLARQCERAIAAGDIAFLLKTFHRSDHWRILADFMDRATFLDIETTGDPTAPDITLIVCFHGRHLSMFTAGDNLDDFLAYLDTIKLLVTFNGATFDLPRIEARFHIPLGHIPHIDLRSVCHHAGMRGGLKQVEHAIGLQRPPDILGVDGSDADWIWERWRTTGDIAHLALLTRYCAADVISLQHLTNWLIARHTGSPCPPFDWSDLPPVTALPPPAPVLPPLSIGTSRQQRLRERLRQRQR